MTSNGDADRVVAEKRRAAEAAVERVADGMTVGLGTGSTAAHAIRAIGDLVADGWSVTGVPTSYQSAELARSVGIRVGSLDDDPSPAIAIDGADQVAPASGALIKGGGGAHAREKVIAEAAGEFVVVVDSRKPAAALTASVPVEVMPMASAPVRSRIEALGGDPTLRTASEKDGPVVTDNGNLLLDCDFGEIQDPSGLARELNAIPGIIEHGLFADVPCTVIVGHESSVEMIEIS